MVTDFVLEAFKNDGIYDHFREELDASLLTSILHVFNLVNKGEKTSPLQENFAQYIRENFPDFESNPCILKENKAAIRCILEGKYVWYHYRFLRKLELVEAVMALSPVAALNDLRKRIMHRERG